jgi:hypothetical protein
MKRGFMMSTAAFLLLGGTALAQTTSQTTSQTTTTGTPMVAPAPVIPPAPGTLSTTETQRGVDSNGNEYNTTHTTYGNMNGASESSTTTTVQPPPAITTKRTTTTTTSY